MLHIQGGYGAGHNAINWGGGGAVGSAAAWRGCGGSSGSNSNGAAGYGGNVSAPVAGGAGGLVVSGCQNPNVASIVHGSFVLVGDNHGRPVYRKQPVVNGVNVELYFWDARDGADFSGWWFGPKVGGDQVWAYHDDKAGMSPPVNSWRVPFGGPVDPMFLVQQAGGGCQSQAQAPQQQQQQWQPQPQTVQPKVIMPTQPPQQQWQQPQAPQQQWQPQAPQPQDQWSQQQQQTDQWGQPQQQQKGVKRVKGVKGQKQSQGSVVVPPGKGQQDQWGQQQQTQQQWEKPQQQQQQQQWGQQKGGKGGIVMPPGGKGNAAKWEELEANRKQEMEAQRQKIEEEKKRGREQLAAQGVRAVIRKYMLVKPDTMEQVKAEVDAKLAQEWENMGSQADAVFTEAAVAEDNARKHCEVLREKEEKEKARQIERRASEEKLRIENETRLESLMQDLEAVVTKAEAQSERLKEKAAKFGEDAPEMDNEKTAACGKEYDEAAADAAANVKECISFVAKCSLEVTKAKPVALLTKLGEEEPIDRHAILAKMKDRLAVVTKATDEITVHTRARKEQATRKAAAKAKTHELEAAIARYDKDGDKVLSKAEARAYAKGEFHFTLSVIATDTIFGNILEPEEKGVCIDKLSSLRIAFGALREAVRDNERVEIEAARQAAMQKLKAELAGKIGGVKEVVDRADKAVKNSEATTSPLFSMAMTMTEADALSKAVDVERIVVSSEKAAGMAQKALDGLGHLAESDRFAADLQKYVAQEAKHLAMRCARFSLRLQRVRNLCVRFRKISTQRKDLALQKARADAMMVLRYNQRLKAIAGDDLFDSVAGSAGGGADSVSEEDFLKFFESADTEVQEIIAAIVEPAAEAAAAPETAPEAAKEEAAANEGDKAAALATTTEAVAVDEKATESVTLGREELKQVFQTLKEDGKTSLSKDAFLKTLRSYMNVVKEAPLMSCLRTKAGKSIRTLAKHEILEVLQGPLLDSDAGLRRVQVRALKDEAEGWCTVVSNYGTEFLCECNHTYKVVRDGGVLTADFATTTGASGTPLKMGDVLEVHEWPKQDGESKLFRVHGKVRGTDTVGWASVSAATGVVFLVPM